MAADLFVPETRVLAVASHVVYGYVGNKMASVVMQLLGCDVAALNTVHFSNHTGYRQFKGTRATAEEITALYEGLTQSHLTDFDVMLSGYAPSAAAVEAVGAIGMDLQRKAEKNPGSFFWVLDPVMGDQGRLYVNNDVVPAYKEMIHHADLILPNQFEAEVLSGVKITSLSTLAEAITAIHATYKVPHVIITSVQISNLSDSSSASSTASFANTLTVIGSTTRSDGSPRLFRVDVPALDCYFSGTGDMFAALTVARLREAVFTADPALRTTKSWVSPDDVPATALPLAQSTVKVLASMHCILEKTMEARNAELQAEVVSNGDVLNEEERKKQEHLRESKAAEVRVVRHVQFLREPTVEFPAQEWSKDDLPVQFR
ncbi:pyridoxal/pyridoxine/pyridoxamine kinase [Aspergillus violaceofuscus CBS 115571]|uniref:pyridoxal kinase n=1 Tax=Aspergillus violaceofuscus (strain CBS 115571) TaxID=1450538 RepID=A0A2V5HBN6_ASPV1|nr:pyridoxal/pyridoxine/pyridoxamine kinase [Aspergillus violaceofuscus CBS 115571]